MALEDCTTYKVQTTVYVTAGGEHFVVMYSDDGPIIHLVAPGEKFIVNDPYELVVPDRWAFYLWLDKLDVHDDPTLDMRALRHRFERVYVGTFDTVAEFGAERMNAYGHIGYTSPREVREHFDYEGYAQELLDRDSSFEGIEVPDGRLVVVERS